MIERREKPQNIDRTLMTMETYQQLQARLIEAHLALDSANKSIGEAAGPEGAWHDNAAYDQALIDSEIRSASVNRLFEALKNVEIIAPRNETSDVGIGNAVEIFFTEEDVVEIFLILGRHDGDPSKNRISYDSPLGAALIGKKTNDLISYRVGDREIQVIIRAIYPGNF